MTLRTRFAPSPTGRLHLGHAFSALCVAEWANRLGAQMLLRIEDIDTTRCRPEFIDGIVEDLDWLGLAYDCERRLQSQHFAEYEACVAALAERGLAYRCFRTRQEVEAELQ